MGKSWTAGVTLTLAGCSGTQKINDSASSIRSLAESSRDRFETHGDTAGVSEQAEIIREVDSIQTAIPAIQDKVPEWLQMASYGVIAVVLLAVIVLLWQTGVGPLVRAVLLRFTSLIPRGRRGEAKLLHEGLDRDGSKEKVREAIAARRAKDAIFDAAWRVEANRHDKRDGADVLESG